MRLAIMQPYFFPYMGYFQMIHAVDDFVIYDSVNYIKRGWINRNNILFKGQPQRFTMSLQNASQNRLINQILIASNRVTLLKSIAQNYAKAPMFGEVFPLIEDILLYEEDNLAKFLTYSLKKLSQYFCINTNWHMASALCINHELRGQDKVLAICEHLGATHYINLPGGRNLYDHSIFLDKGINLSFIQSVQRDYQQFEHNFVPNLSIIDVMMFNDPAGCTALLDAYELN